MFVVFLTMTELNDLRIKNDNYSEMQVKKLMAPT